MDVTNVGNGAKLAAIGGVLGLTGLAAWWLHKEEHTKRAGAPAQASGLGSLLQNLFSTATTAVPAVVPGIASAFQGTPTARRNVAATAPGSPVPNLAALLQGIGGVNAAPATPPHQTPHTSVYNPPGYKPFASADAAASPGGHAAPAPVVDTSAGFGYGGGQGQTWQAVGDEGGFGGRRRIAHAPHLPYAARPRRHGPRNGSRLIRVSHSRFAKRKARKPKGSRAFSFSTERLDEADPVRCAVTRRVAPTRRRGVSVEPVTMSKKAD